MQPKRAHESGILAIAITAAGVWLLSLWLMLAQGFSPITRAQLPDTDDYTRMAQLKRWLDGASWFDLTQPRIDPPFGVEMHWSRLPDLLLASMTLAAEPFFAGEAARENALLFAATWAPALLFLAFLFAVGWTARAISGNQLAPLAVIAAGLSYPLLYQFQPGRVDHHAYQLLLAAVALGLLLRMWENPRALKLGIAASAVMALGLWNSGEMLPWLALFYLTLGVGWLREGSAWAEAGLIFSAALFSGTFALLLAARPPGLWLVPACDAFSIVHVVLAALALLAWAALTLQHRFSLTATSRLLSGAAAGLAASAAFLLLYPQCRGDYSAGLDPQLLAVWLEAVSEAQPLLVAYAGAPGQAVVYFLAPLLAVVLGLWRIVVERGRRREKRIIVFCWLLVAILLSFWQIRGHSFAMLFGVFVLADALGNVILQRAGPTPAWRRLSGFVALALLLPGAGLIAPVFAEIRLGAADKFAGGDGRPPCRIEGVARWLAAPEGFGQQPMLIAARVDHGPAILYYSPHLVLAAPYHRNGRGILDSHRLLTAPSIEAGRAIAAKRHVDLIVLCKKDRGRYAAYAAPDQPALAERLIGGEQIPWIIPVPLPAEIGADGGTLLFRVLAAPAN